MLEHVDPILAMHEKAAAKASQKAAKLRELNALHTQIEKQIEQLAVELTAIYNTDKSAISLANTA